MPDDKRSGHDRRCLDCSGYQARLDDHERKLHDIDGDFISVWKALNKKLGTWWLVLIVPIVVVWLGFQGAMYNGVKNIQKDVAVIQTTIKDKIPNRRIR